MLIEEDGGGDIDVLVKKKVQVKKKKSVKNFSNLKKKGHFLQFTF